MTLYLAVLLFLKSSLSVSVSGPVVRRRGESAVRALRHRLLLRRGFIHLQRVLYRRLHHPQILLPPSDKGNVLEKSYFIVAPKFLFKHTWPFLCDILPF